MKPLSERLRARSGARSGASGIQAALLVATGLAACGAAEPGVAYYWDLDTSVDSDGNGDPADDFDLMGCDVQADFGSAGLRTVRAWAQEPTTNCRSFGETDIEVFDAHFELIVEDRENDLAVFRRRP